jgi:plasmid stabilization system protein ParE
MSDEDVRKTAELKEKIEKELNQLLEKLKAGTIDRKDLESGLERVRATAREIPWFKN